ncbi:LysR family transcriptional regulator [Bacillus horti]|uniref:DNA-binding transcriptional LysR family regulator n=1 Tax=Caldalkalibacillus horti TaxID=77523 RepID=A0ABT9W2G0_9BACI|nr:LysR family transcriptional regulator [Bacillus horti]MDQ0167437.1 DNA-binding transcriptional LysR family regulator [Bacillus horti]
MNLHALRIFTEVAKTGSVTRSAENLLLSQPAVTAQLRNLEKELALKLVTLNGRNIQLTEAGETLAVESKRLFSLEAEIEKKMGEILTGHQGSLRVCSTQLPSMKILPRWLAQYKKKYPMINVQMFKGSSQVAMSQLLDYSVDIAFVCSEVYEEKVDVIPLIRDTLIFIVSRGHHLGGRSVSLATVMKEPFVFREKGSATRKKLVSLCERESIQEPKMGIEIEGLSESIEAVKAGYGVALVSEFAVKDLLESGQIEKVSIQNMHLEQPISLCMRKNDPNSPMVKNFITMVKEELTN